MKKRFFFGIAFAATLIACKDDVTDPDHDHEEEVITSVVLTFTDGANNTQTFSFSDPDGDGGTDPSIDTISLDTNATYTVAISFLNESETPAEDMTSEVQSEANDHLVCFTTNSNIGVTITDQDGNGLDLGLTSEWLTGNAETSSITISLKHQPEIKDGSCNIGETDVEAEFPLVIQ